MEYTEKKDLIFLDVSFSPQPWSLFREFLRQKMFSPVVKGVEFINGSANERIAYYSGCFEAEVAREIQVWLEQNGVKLKSGERK